MPIYKYSSFNLIEKDKCYDQFDMQLDLNKAEITSELDRRFEEIEGCGVSMKMILKGILRKVPNTILDI